MQMLLNIFSSQTPRIIIMIIIEMIFHLFLFDPVVSIVCFIYFNQRNLTKLSHSIDDIVTIRLILKEWSVVRIPNSSSLWEYEREKNVRLWEKKRNIQLHLIIYRLIMCMEFQKCSFTAFSFQHTMTNKSILDWSNANSANIPVYLQLKITTERKTEFPFPFLDSTQQNTTKKIITFCCWMKQLNKRISYSTPYTDGRNGFQDKLTFWLTFDT